jgi:hypothetical protein
MDRGVEQTWNEMPGQRSWYVSVGETGKKPFGWLAAHRVPLNNGEDVYMTCDSGPEVPGGPVFAVVGGRGDTYSTKARRLLPDHHDPDSVTAAIFVLEPVVLEEEWTGLGVEELLLATVLSDLQDLDVSLAVVQPVRWDLKGKARTAAGARHKPIFQNLGFVPFVHGAWVLADWSSLHEAHAIYQERFGLPTWRDVY